MGPDGVVLIESAKQVTLRTKPGDETFGDLDADMLQLAPMALYNYVAFDRPGGAEGQIVIDMGAENT